MLYFFSPLGPQVSPTPIFTIYPSQLPTSDSMQPTLSPAPSASPSSVPSALLSNGPSRSVAPSLNPTVLASSVPSSIPSAMPSFVPSSSPSLGPSVLDSYQPTRYLSPSGSPSIFPSIFPSLTPSVLPSLVASGRPSASAEPSIQPSIKTAAPSIPRDEQKLPIFTLEYQLFDYKDPTETDLVELEALTRDYLRDHIIGEIVDANSLLDDFFTTSTGQKPDSGALIVNVEFESTAFYNPNSPTSIPMNDFIKEIENAFTGDELDEYLGMVQALPNSNLFAGAIQIFMISQLESRNQRSFLSVVLAGSAVFISLLGGYGLVRYQRRKSASRKASQNFLENVLKDSVTDCSSLKRDCKSSKVDSWVSSAHENNSNPFGNSCDVRDRLESGEFAAKKKTKYSRPRMHRFSDDL